MYFVKSRWEHVIYLAIYCSNKKIVASCRGFVRSERLESSRESLFCDLDTYMFKRIMYNMLSTNCCVFILFNVCKSFLCYFAKSTWEHFIDLPIHLSNKKAVVSCRGLLGQKGRRFPERLFLLRHVYIYICFKGILYKMLSTNVCSFHFSIR